MPRVAVIILSHRADLLPQAFASALGQTYRDREIVVKYAEAWWAEKLNEAIASSRSELFVVLCDDDKLRPSYLEETIAALDRDDTDFAYTDNLNFGPMVVKQTLPDFSLHAVQRDCVPHFTALTRRSLWERVGGYDATQPYLDWDFWLRAAKADARGTHLTGRFLFDYRIGPQNGSRGMSHRECMAALQRKHPDVVLPADLVA